MYHEEVSSSTPFLYLMLAFIMSCPTVPHCPSYTP